MDNIYDHIIVGAGSSGCVLAERLTANGRARVLLIESGPADRSPYVGLPRGFPKLLSNPRLVHMYVAKPTGGANAPEYWLRGRMLGGSSSVNGMVYVRGQPADYDEWEAQGCAGWGWNDLKRCFVAIERHELGPGEDRGGAGPLRVTVHPAGDPLCDAMIEAGHQMGLPKTDDINSLKSSGIGYQARTIWRGRRQSAARAFLKPALGRPNLHVMSECDVTELLFEGSRCTGVRAGARSGVVELHARETILCAGAIASPLLLQRSGIGRAGVLKAAGIEVRLDSPDVGHNMREHRLLRTQFRLRRGSQNGAFRGLGLVGSALRYALLRSGPLSSAAFEVGGFVRTEPGEGRPDAQLGMGPFSLDTSRLGFNMEAEHGAMCGGYVMRPESRGTVLPGGPALSDMPLIDPNYLATDYDRRVSVALFRYMRALFAQPALAPYVVGETMPGPSVHDDSEIVDAFHRSGASGFHAAGTCRMGADDASVVDPSLRVRGISGLRVADISVMPSLVSGNTNAPAMAMAWRAAEIISA